MRFAASLVGPDHAADLVSEVVVATLQQRELASIEQPKAYLMQGVLNRARSRGRRLARESVALRHMPSPVGDSEPVDYVMNDDIIAAVARLPLQQRAAIYFVFWEDLDPTAAAALMGVSPGTLRRYLYLARNKLRAWIDE